MSRLRADFLLVITATIWGTAFIAQKTGMDGLDPAGFTGVRFILSALVILPLALREKIRAPAALPWADMVRIIFLSVIFFFAVYTQQAGLLTTSVANAGFLTGLYVIIVPFIAWPILGRPPAFVVWPACLLAVAGTWLLNEMKLSAFSQGDLLVLLSAVLFAAHIAFLGSILRKTARPFLIVITQYAVCAILGLVIGSGWEGMQVSGIGENLVQILYAGFISGGIAYTLQAVAQQYTPPSDAAIIMAAEAPVAAIAGAVFIKEYLTLTEISGCAIILLAIVLVEAATFIPKRKLGKI